MPAQQPDRFSRLMMTVTSDQTFERIGRLEYLVFRLGALVVLMIFIISFVWHHLGALF